MEPLFISIQGSYKKLEVALHRGQRSLESVHIESIRASADTLSLLEQLLRRHNITIQDLSFMAIDSGPGAFTSLRVMITTVNAIAFATNLLIIGIDGLDALAQQVFMQMQEKTADTAIMPLLNAYSNDVYVASYNLCQNNQSWYLTEPVDKGCYKIDELIHRLNHEPPAKKIIVVGNALALHQKALENITEVALECDSDSSLATCSTEQIAHSALRLWEQGYRGVKKISPLYLKQSI